MPANVRDLLLSRLSAVGETGRQILDTAAVIGRSFAVDVLQQASGRGEDEVIAALEGLLEKRLVSEVDTGEGSEFLRYDFGHEQLRTLAYEEMSLARRRLLHRRVAEAMAKRPRDREQAGVVAVVIAEHYHLAGQDDEAANHFKLAGDHARSLFANAEALAHYRSALTLGYVDVASLHEAVGDLETLIGNYGAAIAAYEKAAAVSDEDYLAGFERKLGDVYLRRGDSSVAESHFHAALHALGEEGSAAERSRAYADWSLAAHRKGDTDRARDLASRAVELAEDANDTEALAQGQNILGILSRNQGDFDGACQHLEQSLALTSEPSARVAALNNLALALSNYLKMARRHCRRNHRSAHASCNTPR